MNREKETVMITEKQYLEYLIKQYQNLIYSICLKSVGNPFDAEDLTQEVFLSAYKNLSRFDGNYEKAWLSKIAVRKCLDYLKAAGWAAKYSNRRHLLFPDSGQAILSRR